MSDFSPDPGLANTSFSFEGRDLLVTKDGVWHLEVAGRTSSSRYLDLALAEVFPGRFYPGRDLLQVQILEWATALPAEDRHQHRPGEGFTAAPA